MSSPPGSDPAEGLLDLVQRVAAEAGPDEQVEAFASRSRSVTVRAHGGEVESLSVAEPAGVGVRVVVDGRQGFAYCGSLDETVVRETLDAARDNARFAQPDPDAGLAIPDGVAPRPVPSDPAPIEALPLDDKVALALALESATVGLDPRVRAVRVAAYGDDVGASAVATSTGIAAVGSWADAGLSVAALANDDSGTTVGGFADAARDPAALDPDAIAAEAVGRATRLLGAGPIPSTRLTVIFEPRLAATLVALVVGTLGGEAVVKGRSPFADRMGQEIASPLLSVVDDPTDVRSLSASPHDGEGLATRRNVLVRDGVLEGFLHNSWTARRLGTRSTASAVRGVRSTPGVGARALAMTAGEGTFDELVAGVSHGLVVQSLVGLHSGVNPVSGDVSVGAEGLLVRDGVVGAPVREVTLASTLQRMLSGITAVGSDLQWLPGGSAAATIVIGEMSLGGT